MIVRLGALGGVFLLVMFGNLAMNTLANQRKAAAQRDLRTYWEREAAAGRAIVGTVVMSDSHQGRLIEMSDGRRVAISFPQENPPYAIVFDPPSGTRVAVRARPEDVRPFPLISGRHGEFHVRAQQEAFWTVEDAPAR
jgi:hypothetical protein